VKTLKDLLTKEPRVTTPETAISLDDVHGPYARTDVGLAAQVGLTDSIEANGLQSPITVWTDGTLVSGRRRLHAYHRLAERPGGEKYRTIPAVTVGTIEDAAKRMLADNSNETHALPMKPSEICRWWDLMRQLDAPAAAARLYAARQQGVKLRKQTLQGKRSPGRNRDLGKGEEYLLYVLAEPFGMSEPTASRLYALHKVAASDKVTDERRQAALDRLAALDRGEMSIWKAYADQVASNPKKPAPTFGAAAQLAAEPAPAAKQLAAWARSLPQMEGLTLGLAELGNPNSGLTWEQVGPVHARLMKIRRDLEKIIKGMKETAQS